MFSQIFCFFLISCIYCEITCAPAMNWNEDDDFTISLDQVKNNVNDEYHEVKGAVDTTAEDAKRSFNDNYEKGKDKVEEISNNIKHTLEDEHQKNSGFLQNVVDKLKHDASNLVEGTKNIVNKINESGMNAFKNTQESVQNSVNKSLQSAGEFIDAGIKNGKDNLSTLFTFTNAPVQQTTDFINGLRKN